MPAYSENVRSPGVDRPHSVKPTRMTSTDIRSLLIWLVSGSGRNRSRDVSLSSMKYRDTEYQILQTANPTGWEWIVPFAGTQIRSGSTYIAQRAIDKLLTSGMKAIAPSPLSEGQ